MPTPSKALPSEGEIVKLGLIQVDIAGHSKISAPGESKKKARTIFRQKMIAVAERQGLELFMWAGDGGSFMTWIRYPDQYDKIVETAIQLRREIPSINKEIAEKTDLNHRLEVRISCGAGEAHFSHERSCISGDFVNAFLKNEREISSIESFTITGSIYKEIPSRLRDDFRPKKRLRYSRALQDTLYTHKNSTSIFHAKKMMWPLAALGICAAPLVIHNIDTNTKLNLKSKDLSLTIYKSLDAPSTADTMDFIVTPDTPVKALGASDFSIINGTINSLKGPSSGNNYTLNVTPSQNQNGVMTISLKAKSIKSLDGRTMNTEAKIIQPFDTRNIAKMPRPEAPSGITHPTAAEGCVSGKSLDQNDITILRKGNNDNSNQNILINYNGLILCDDAELKTSELKNTGYHHYFKLRDNINYPNFAQKSLDSGYQFILNACAPFSLPECKQSSNSIFFGRDVKETQAIEAAILFLKNHPHSDKKISIIRPFYNEWGGSLKRNQIQIQHRTQSEAGCRESYWPLEELEKIRKILINANYNGRTILSSQYSDGCYIKDWKLKFSRIPEIAEASLGDTLNNTYLNIKEVQHYTDFSSIPQGN